MEQQSTDVVWPVARHARFELAPPRRFLLPALLLLLAEEPGYGYHLAKGLEDLRFGRVDRPSVYRALAQLEGDGLVESWPGAPKAGQARRVYGLTDQGERALRAWMGVVKQERDCLDLVLQRYVATGTIDAVLAEAEGGWAAVTGHPWSPVSPTARIERHQVAFRSATASHRPEPHDCPEDEVVDAADGDEDDLRPTRYRVVPERSAVLIEARSTVGPITFGAVGVTGRIEADVRDGVVRAGSLPSADIELDVATLRSGNGLYDAELMRRIDARRHPVVALHLMACTPIGSTSRYQIDGEVSFHGCTRQLQGTIAVSSTGDGNLLVSGEQVFDIRDFEIASPTALMLRIYPDVVVQLQVEAEPLFDESPDGSER